MNNQMNQTLLTFLQIKEQISALEKQLKPLETEIKAAGSMENAMFIVEVKEITVHRTVGCEELLEKVGFVETEKLGLIKSSTYNKLTVKMKAK